MMLNKALATACQFQPRNPVKLLPEPLTTKHKATPAKPLSWLDEDTLKQTGALMIYGQTMGCDHAEHYSERDLPPIPEGGFARYLKPRRAKAVIKASRQPCRLLNINVCSALAFDVYQTC